MRALGPDAALCPCGLVLEASARGMVAGRQAGNATRSYEGGAPTGESERKCSELPQS